MNLADLNAFIQSGGVFSLLAVLAYRMPSIWQAIVSFIERSRKFQSDQAMNERMHRDAYAEKMAAALEKLSHSILDLRAATVTVCKFREIPNTAFFGERPPGPESPRQGK